jgi:hypothetical protein
MSHHRKLLVAAGVLAAASRFAPAMADTPCVTAKEIRVGNTTAYSGPGSAYGVPPPAGATRRDWRTSARRPERSPRRHGWRVPGTIVRHSGRVCRECERSKNTGASALWYCASRCSVATIVSRSAGSGRCKPARSAHRRSARHPIRPVWSVAPAWPWHAPAAPRRSAPSSES